MESNFYAQIQCMVESAIVALDAAEERSSAADAFSPCKAIGAACREGGHLQIEIGKDLGPLRKHEF